MKKVFALVAILLVAFIILIYLSVSSTSKKFETCTIENLEDLEKVNFEDHDSVTLAPSSLYKGDLLKEFMQGENYRQAWSTPVNVPIVFLDTLYGGMKIIKEGGGKQTHSLKLQNKSGIMFTLRSVAKDPEKLIPDVAKNLGLENIIVDGISGQHPYGALLSARLSDIAGVAHTNPKLVFIPKQTSLGDFNEKYGNRLYLLENETESKENWTSYPKIDLIVETDDLQKLKQENRNSIEIDKPALIRARLFDLFIGDWDRHAEQWGWALQKSGDIYKAIPVAGDRDNAFFNLSGVIPSILTNKNVEPLVRPFEKEIDHMPGLVYPFDRYFLLNAPREIYLQQAESLQQELTDEKIDKAFDAWPEAIAKLDKKEIFEKLKSRRDQLDEYAVAFYEIIQEKGKLTEPLKGSEDLEIDEDLIGCFDCSQDEL